MIATSGRVISVLPGPSIFTIFYMNCWPNEGQDYQAPLASKPPYLQRDGGLSMDCSSHLDLTRACESHPCTRWDLDPPPWMVGLVSTSPARSNVEVKAYHCLMMPVQIFIEENSLQFNIADRG